MYRLVVCQEKNISTTTVFFTLQAAFPKATKLRKGLPCIPHKPSIKSIIKIT